MRDALLSMLLCDRRMGHVDFAIRKTDVISVNKRRVTALKFPISDYGQYIISPISTIRLLYDEECMRLNYPLDH